MRRFQFTISWRLTVWFFSIFFLGWLLFGLAMGLSLKSSLTNERYQTLARRLDRLQQLLDNSADENQADRVQEFTDFARATGNGLAEVRDANGNGIFPSPSAAARNFSWPKVDSAKTEQFLHVLSSGQPYWVLIRSYSAQGRSAYLFAAAPEAGNLIILAGFWRALLLSAPVLLLVSSIGGYWLSRTALRPVDRITAAAHSISIRNLSERLPVRRSGDELQRLAETCNAMLERLDSAVTQLRRFTADASHELRGPISFVRTVAEVALRNTKMDEESGKAFQEIIEETEKAAELLEGMLTLARADASSAGVALEPVELNAVLSEACTLARPIAETKGLTLLVNNHASRPAIILGDFSILRRLLWILLDNALKYTEAPGLIEVSLTIVAAHALIAVKDSGIGIDDESLPHIFDRFYRADPSRSQVEGCGLGLAIAKWIADLHQAELSVSSKLRQGSTFLIVFPIVSG